MMESDWKQVRIRPELHAQIEKVKVSKKEKGIRKYKSVPQFVERACILLLDKEGIN